MHNIRRAWITFTALLLFIYTFAIANPPGSTNKIYVYDCGDIEVSNKDIHLAFSDAKKDILMKTKYPKAYDGKLDYKHANSIMMYPIKQKGQISTNTSDHGYFVIFVWLGGVLGVIRRTPDGDIQCSKRYPRPSFLSAQTSSPPPFNNLKPTLTPSKLPGYQCARDFFTLEIVQNSVNYAMIQKKEKNQGYSIKYFGTLCPKSKCLLSPIHYADNIDGSADSGDGFKYYILSDERFGLKYVVDQAPNGDFNTCKRAANTLGRPLRTDIKREFQCRFLYFNKSYLSSQLALSLLTKATKYMNVYPKTTLDAQSDTKVILWPLKRNGQSSSLKITAVFFLVMNTKYQIICVAIIIDNIKCCPPRIESVDKLEEKGDFLCFGVFRIPHINMVAAKKDACESNFDRSRAFPATYSGPDFEIPRPYYTWPLIVGNHERFGTKNRHPGSYRIVVNEYCKLAGVIVIDENNVISKCQRSDGTTPGENSILPETRFQQSIHEISNVLSRKKRKLNLHKRKMKSSNSISNHKISKKLHR